MLKLPIPPSALPVLLRRDLVNQGFSDDEIRAAVGRGELERISRGAVSLAAPGENTYEAKLNRYLRRVIARALGVPSCVVSHLSAAAMHGLPADCAPLRTVHLTRLGRSGNRTAPGFVQHAAALPEESIERLGGARVTGVPRTLVDVGRTEILRSAVAIADAALHRELVTGSEVAAALKDAARSPGMCRARRALALADGRSESVGESFLRVLFHAHGLAGLQLQVRVYSDRGEFLGRCDFGLLDSAVFIEFDGFAKYQRYLRPGESATDAVVREKLREERLSEAGFVVVRVTWDDLKNPRALMERIHRATTRGRRNLTSGIVTGVCEPLPANGIAA